MAITAVCFINACEDDAHLTSNDTSCLESAKPATATTCDCEDGVWQYCIYPVGDKCAKSNCAAGEICDSTTGECKKSEINKCAGVSCNADETCNPATGICDKNDVDKCAGVSCNADETCNPATGICDKNDVDKCAGVSCNADETCNPATGICDKNDVDKCAGVLCNADETCNPATGICDKNDVDKCAGVSCNADETCNPATGICDKNSVVNTANISITGENSMDENSSTTLTVKLDPKPLADVTVKATLTTPDICSISGDDSLSFKTSDTVFEKEITIEATNNDIIDGDRDCHIVFNATSSDTNEATTYHNKTAEITVSVKDDDKAGIIVSGGGLISVYDLDHEDDPRPSSSDYCYTLKTKPESQVVLAITLERPSAQWVQLDKTSIIIIPELYNQKTNCVKVTDIFDYSIMGTPDWAEIKATAISSDTNYNNITITAGILFSDYSFDGFYAKVSPNLRYNGSGLHEGQNESGTLRIALGKKPSATTTVTLSYPTDTINVTPNKLTFTTSTWHEYQTVIIKPVEDNIYHKDGWVKIEYTADANFYSVSDYYEIMRYDDDK